LRASEKRWKNEVFRQKRATSNIKSQTNSIYCQIQKLTTIPCRRSTLLTPSARLWTRRILVQSRQRTYSRCCRRSMNEDKLWRMRPRRRARRITGQRLSRSLGPSKALWIYTTTLISMRFIRKCKN
jgi:hypothetical protein